MDHAGPHKFDPAGAFAGFAAFAITKEAREVQFETGFHKREISWAEAYFYRFSEEAAEKFSHDSFEVAEGNVFVDEEAFHLIECGVVGGVGGFVAEYSSRDDQSQWRAVFFHAADLDRRGVRAQNHSSTIFIRFILNEKSVLHVAGGVIGRDVQSFKIVIFRFDFRTVGDHETHLIENAFDFGLNL